MKNILYHKIVWMQPICIFYIWMMTTLFFVLCIWGSFSDNWVKDTDVNWYIENIGIKLRERGCIIEAFKFEEF